MLCIKNGTVADPISNLYEKRNLYIENDRIVKISKPEEIQLEAASILDASGCIVAPGLVDAHVHFRDPGLMYKEDILTGASAAAAGGFTTVICMANTKPVIDSPELVSYVIQKGRETGIHVLTCAAITKGLKGEELTNMSELKTAGAVGFTDDGIPIMKKEILLQAMDKARELDMPISLHEENPTLIGNNGINDKVAREIFKLEGSPREAEISMVERDLQLALQTGAKLNIQHISTKEALAAVCEAKKKGSNIHAEGTPQHFSLTQEAVIEKKTLAKVNPPLREEDDRRAIIAGIADGTIDMIATDHAPHSEEEKNRELTVAPSGMIGLETSLALALTHLYHEEHLPLLTILDRMTVGPSKFYGLPSGRIQEGGQADLVIFNTEEEWTVPSTFASKSKNSPFIGVKLKGRVRSTICAGKIVYQLREEENELR